MTISDAFMIAAVLLGPVLAVQVQKFIEKINDVKIRKLWVFKTLMATRGAALSPQHVQALNMIDLEFTSNNKKDKAVIDAWKTYLDHLCKAPHNLQDANYQAEFTLWANKSSDYLAELLFVMSKSVGYDFDKVRLKNGAYSPQGHVDIENDIFQIRKGVLEILNGRRPLPVKECQ